MKMLRINKKNNMAKMVLSFVFGFMLGGFLGVHHSICEYLLRYAFIFEWLLMFISVSMLVLIVSVTVYSKIKGGIK